MTLSDLERLKSASFASRAISAVPELLVNLSIKRVIFHFILDFAIIFSVTFTCTVILVHCKFGRL